MCVLVPLPIRISQAEGERIMIRSEMRIPHGHLYCSVATQLRNRRNIYPSHRQPRRKRVPGLVPGLVLDLDLRHRRIEPLSGAIVRLDNLEQSVLRTLIRLDTIRFTL